MATHSPIKKESEMNGNNKWLVDTNILIFLLQGNRKIADLLVGKTIYISFITEIELLGVQGMSPAEQKIVREVITDCQKLGFNEIINQATIRIKQKRKVKIPDAIIAATAIENNLPLLTADTAFSSIPELNCILLELE